MTEAIYENAAGNGTQGAPTQSYQRRRALWAKFILLSAVFALSILWRAPDEPRFNLCLFRALTGVLCPGCGMTRAFCALSHGEFWRAVHFNLLSPAVYFGFWLAWAHALAGLLKLEKIRAAFGQLAPTGRVAKALLLLVGVWWAARLISHI